MLRPTALALILAAAATAASPAMAQNSGAYGYNSAPAPAYRPVAPAPAYRPITPAPAMPVRPGTRIYQTTPAGTATVYVAPRNCGVYRYWDGTECVDARDDPPPLDRERPIGW